MIKTAVGFECLISTRKPKPQEQDFYTHFMIKATPDLRPNFHNMMSDIHSKYHMNKGCASSQY